MQHLSYSPPSSSIRGCVTCSAGTSSDAVLKFTASTTCPSVLSYRTMLIPGLFASYVTSFTVTAASLLPAASVPVTVNVSSPHA